MQQQPPSLDLVPLEHQLADAGFDVSRGIGMDDSTGNEVYTYDEFGVPEALPEDAQHIVDSFLEGARQPPESSG
jgi:hypothetical protein